MYSNQWLSVYMRTFDISVLMSIGIFCCLSNSLVGIPCETTWTFVSTQCSDLEHCGQSFNTIVYCFYEENTSLNLFPLGEVLGNQILSENYSFNLVFKCVYIELNRNIFKNYFCFSDYLPLLHFLFSIIFINFQVYDLIALMFSCVILSKLNKIYFCSISHHYNFKFI